MQEHASVKMLTAFSVALSLTIPETLSKSVT